MGFFKSIFRGVKKIFKGVAKVVKSIVKPIVKVVKKALKNPIVKALVIAAAVAYGGYFLVNQSLIGSGTHFLNFMQNPLSTNLFVPTATSEAGKMLVGSNIIAGQGVAGGLMSGTEAMASWEGVNVGGQMLQGGQVVTAGTQVGSAATMPGAKGGAPIPDLTNNTPDLTNNMFQKMATETVNPKSVAPELGKQVVGEQAKASLLEQAGKVGAEVKKIGESTMAGDLTTAAEGTLGAVVESGKFVAKGANVLYQGFKNLPSPVQTALVQGGISVLTMNPDSPHYAEEQQFAKMFAEAPQGAQDQLVAYWGSQRVQDPQDTQQPFYA